MDKELNVKQRNVLRELVKNGRISDKAIAKKLGYSQPTVTRIRSRLEAEGYILRYCTIPNFNKIGYEIVAIIAFSSYKEPPAIVKKGVAWTMKNKNITFACRGEGFNGRTRAIITMHKNFTDYDNFMRELRQWEKHGMSNITSFIIPLKLVLKNMSFENLI